MEDINSNNWHPSTDHLLDFLDGLFTDDTAKKIKTHLENCEDCKTVTVSLQRQIKTAGSSDILRNKQEENNSKALLDFKSKLNQLSSETPKLEHKEKTKIRTLIPQRIIGLIAASVLLLIVFVPLFNKDNTNLLALDVPNNKEITKSDNLENSYEEGKQLYFSKAFEAAEQKLIVSDTLPAAYYLGLIYYSQNKTDLAKMNFEKAATLKESRFGNTSNYYLALINYQSKNYQNALTNLELIDDSNLALKDRNLIAKLKSKIDKQLQ